MWYIKNWYLGHAMSSQSLWTSQDSRGDVTHALQTSIYWACPTSLKIRSTNATCVQIYGKKVYGIHQYTMSQAHVRSKSNFLCATFHTSLAPLVRSHRIELDKSSNATGLPKAMVKMGGARPLETLGSRISGSTKTSENHGNAAWGVTLYYVTLVHPNMSPSNHHQIAWGKSRVWHHSRFAEVRKQVAANSHHWILAGIRAQASPNPNSLKLTKPLTLSLWFFMIHMISDMSGKKTSSKKLETWDFYIPNSSVVVNPWKSTTIHDLASGSRFTRMRSNCDTSNQSLAPFNNGSRGLETLNSLGPRIRCW